MRYIRLTALLLFATGACDVPTSPEDARDRLAEGRDQLISLTVPLPAAELNIREEIEDGTIGFVDVIDTEDFTIHLEPDPFKIGFDPFWLDVTNLAPILEAFELKVDPFDVDLSIQVDPISVDLPARTFSRGLPPILGVASELLTVLDYADTYETVSLSSGSEMQVEINTNGGGTVNSATAALLDQAGNTLASSTDTVTLSPGERSTLVIPIGGQTLSNSLQVRIDAVTVLGDSDAEDDIVVVVSFTNVRVTAATQVVANLLSPMTITQRVALDQTGSDFTLATLATGTLFLTQFDFGDLTFTQGDAFETDLAGKRIGLTPPDSITVAGTVTPPVGSSRVNVNTAGSVKARVSNITLSSATLTDIDMDVARTADVLDENSGDLKGVRSAEITTGTLTLEMINRMPVSGTITITLAGTTGPGGATLSQSINITASTNGSLVSHTMNFDLAGATVVPAQLEASVTGKLVGSGVAVTSEIAADAFKVQASTSLSANAVTLANAGDSLSINFETTTEFTKSELRIEDGVDFLKELSLNDVDLTLTIQNPTGVELTLDSVVVTLISLPSEQSIPGASGSDLSVLVKEGSTGSIVVPGNGTKQVVVDASALVSKLLNELSADRRAGIKASGKAGVGGASGRISVSDELTVALDIRAPVDLSIPASGAKIDVTSHNVVDLSGTAADVIVDLSNALVRAVLKFEITNPIPVALELDVALAPTPPESQRDSFNPFNASRQLVVRGISVGAAPADARGRATGSTVRTVNVDVPTKQLTVFKEGEMTLRVDATILPPALGSRSLITGDEVIIFKPKAQLTINIKGKAGGE